jgi:hypothetical protein
MHPYGQHKNRFLFCFILFFCFLEITACGINEDSSTDSNHGTGTYAARLIFPPEIARIESMAESTNKAIQGGINCAEANIATINCSLFSAGDTPIKEVSWPCSRGEGTISDIPPGSGITVVVTVKDNNNNVVLWGEERDVTISPNQQTEGGEIILSRTVSAGSDPKTLVFDWQYIISPDGVDHYQLQISPSGDSNFTTIEGADHIVDTSFTLTIPVHLTDWVNTVYRVVALDAAGNVIATSSTIDLLTTVASEEVIGYFKASNTNEPDYFGTAIALSTDGNTLAVGAYGERSGATEIDGDETNNSLDYAGAAYLFTRSGKAWQQQAYIKASNTDSDDWFGRAIALSTDGNTLVVGAEQEDSAARGTNGDETDNSMEDAGAVYLFIRNNDIWQQQAYVKASNTDAYDGFGTAVALSADGNTLAVGADGEDSAALRINGDEADNSMDSSGAVYLFIRNNDIWQQQAYVKASNTDAYDGFGTAVALSADGNTLAVGADGEDSAAIRINGDEADNSMENAGAVYLFTRSGSAWQQQAYIKAGSTNAGDWFGSAVALSANGNTLAVGGSAGAVYLFTRSGSAWQQQAYIRASNTDAGDGFGGAVALSDDGNTLAVGAENEASTARGINGDEINNSMESAGAVYLFRRRVSAWQQQAYIKANNTDPGDWFGATISIDGDSNTLAIGAPGEDSAAQGVNGDETDNSIDIAGAVYLY